MMHMGRFTNRLVKMLGEWGVKEVDTKTSGNMTTVSLRFTDLDDKLIKYTVTISSTREEQEVALRL